MAPRFLAATILLAVALSACMQPSPDAASAPGSAAPQNDPAEGGHDVSDWPRVPACSAPELNLFSCSLVTGRSVALCASPEASQESGYVRFALGKGENAEVVMPAFPSAPAGRFKSTRALAMSGNGRESYSLETGGRKYVLYRVWAARDGNAARGGLMVLDDAGVLISDEPCTSMNDAEQVELDRPPFALEPDPLLDDGSMLPFGEALE
jgi:hypothetical protein